MVDSGDRVHLSFRFHPTVDTDDGLLAQYIKWGHYHPSFTSKELILKSLRMSWMPFAYRDVGNKSAKDIKKAARDAIRALEQHADYLRAEFGIEPKAVPPSLSHIYSVPVSAAPQIPAESNGEGFLSEKMDAFAKAALEEEPDTGGL